MVLLGRVFTRVFQCLWMLSTWRVSTASAELLVIHQQNGGLKYTAVWKMTTNGTDFMEEEWSGG